MKIILGLLFFISSTLVAQHNDVSDQLARSIESESMKEHVYTLASKDFQGRETGKEGNFKAADYIAGQLVSYGIPPIPGDTDHFQEVSFTTFKWENIQLSVSGEAVEHLKEYIAIPQHFPVQTGPIDISSMIFLGYGIDDEAYSDFEGVDVRGKHLLVYAGEPRDPNDNFRLTGSDSISEWSYDPFYKIEAAKKAGAASLWIIEDDFRQMAMYARRELLSGATLMETPEHLNDYLPQVYVAPTLGQKLAGKKVNKVIKLRDKITKTGKPAHTSISVFLLLNELNYIKSTTIVNLLIYI